MKKHQFIQLLQRRKPEKKGFFGRTFAFFVDIVVNPFMSKFFGHEMTGHTAYVEGTLVYDAIWSTDDTWTLVLKVDNIRYDEELLNLYNVRYIHVVVESDRYAHDCCKRNRFAAGDEMQVFGPIFYNKLTNNVEVRPHSFVKLKK